MKSLVCLLAGIIALQSAVSQTISPEDAAEYAANALYYHHGIAERENPQLIHTYREEQNPVYYTFTTDDAFVIISAEKSYLPVLAHSSEGGLPSDPDRLPPAFVEWMNSLAEDITAVRNGQLSIDEEKLQTWDIVETRQPGPQPTRAVLPLLTTTWNQGCGYNGMCPVDASGPCNHVYTGCVATTQAQVMKYHAHPASGIGNECYTHSDYGELCADYAAANYDWAAMPNNSGSAEVEELMYHCGVSVSMNYSPSGSGSYLSRVDNALRDHFDYTTNLDEVSRYHFDPADWDDLMRKECDAGRVMAYKGTGSGGHAFVLDGYNDFGEFHFNWGWGGTADGYYVMGNLNPSGHDYSGSNAAIIGVEPATDFSGMDFSGITTLGCGITQPVDLSTGISEVNVYGNANIDAVGKEKVYEFTTALPGRITINLENPSSDISVVLLSHQHRDSVLSFGTNGLIYDNSTPATYYLVLDVAHAQNASADLELICPTADPDLIAQNVQVIPNTIESNQTGVIMKSTIKNIGNSASTVCDMEYYLSDNDTLDGGDLLIASTTIPILNAGDDTIVESIHTMPVLPVAGYYYVFGVPDASNTVVETVEDDYGQTNVQIPDTGMLDCTSASAVSDGLWYYDNTATNGDSLIDNSGCAWNHTGNEMIYTMTSPNSGIANISFTEKHFGKMTMQVLPICNENANCLTSLSIWNTTDTLVNSSFNAEAGATYYLLVDGENDLSGEFGFKVDFPEPCPDDTLQYWGDTARCDGDGGLNMQLTWGYDSYQWFKDGVEIPDASSMSYVAETTGEYYAEITENGCTVESDHLNVAFSPAPDTAAIEAVTDTVICGGGSAELQLTAGNAWDVLWYKDGQAIPGATADTYLATETGVYHAEVINASCHLMSGEVQVHVNQLPVDIGQNIPLQDESLVFHFPLDDDAQDISGNGHGIANWDWYPADDHDGNFWQARQFIDSATSSHVYTQFNNPENFTLSMWFKSNDGLGGSLILFTDDVYSPGGAPDRSLYMSDDGKLHFYLNNSGTPVEIVSSDTYNDGNWHHVVIKAGGFAEMEIDQAEYLSDATTLSLDNIDGKWMYGGNDIPSGASNPPAYDYFLGGIDDLRYYSRKLSAQETMYFTESHNLSASLASDTICNGGIVYLDIPYSQPGILYMVRDIATGDTLTVDGIGTGGALSLGGDLYNSSADFEVVAVDTASGCSRILSDSWHLEVLPDETPDVSITSGSGTDICSGDDVNLTSSTFAAGSSPAFTWLLNGSPTGDTGNALTISTLSDGDSIQLIMNSSYTCATIPVDTSDALYFNVQDYPVVSFDYESEYCADEDITVTYTGDETGVSIAWEVYGTMQTETGPGTHNFDFSTPAIVDITAIGTTSFGCETSHTETTEVLANPVASFIMPSDLCANQEFQVEYTGTETGMDTIIWTTSPAPIQSSTGVGIHTFTAYGTGSFDVMINVTDNNGCTASAIQTAPVHQQPVVDFTIPAEACAGQQIQAEYIGTEWDNTNVSWYVDDTDQGVTAPGTGTVWLGVPETTGTIDVMASAITDYGCTNDTTHSLTVNDSPTAPLDDTTWICPNQATLLDAENPGAEYNWSTGDTTQVISLYNNTGFLSVMIDNGVCSIVDTTELVMYPSDMFEFPEGTDTVVCTGDSLYLDVFPPYTGVEWHLYGDTVSGSELAYPYVGQDSVLVEVFAYNENGCPGMDTLMVYYQTCSGVKDIAENLSVDLFPNPAGNKLYIKASTTMNMDISIHDLTGKILLTKSKCSGDTMFDVYGLPEGMYLVRIDSGKETITKKLNIVR